MPHETATVDSLFRYPIKGLSGERLSSIALEPDRRFPGDRAFAIEARDLGLETGDMEFRKKSFFHQLARDPALARIESAFDVDRWELTLTVDGQVVAEGSIRTEAGREAIEEAVAEILGPDLPRQPRLIDGGGVQFTDQSKPLVSIINLASVADIGTQIGAELEPIRFRGNIYVDGMPAWAENDLIGKRLQLGSEIVVEIDKRIERCAATEVDPRHGERNRPVVETLYREFGHKDCGVFARVLRGGLLTQGSTVAVHDGG